MSEHTPDTDQVRLAYLIAETPDATISELREEFDRWLVAELAAAKAEAWDEAVEDALDPPPNPYRERTDDDE